MIDTLVKELDTEMTEAEVNEKNAQEEYEEMMADSSAKRAADTKSAADKSAVLADTEALIVASCTESAIGSSSSSMSGPRPGTVRLMPSRRQKRSSPEQISLWSRNPPGGSCASESCSRNLSGGAMDEEDQHDMRWQFQC